MSERYQVIVTFDAESLEIADDMANDLRDFLRAMHLAQISDPRPGITYVTNTSVTMPMRVRLDIASE